MKLHISNHKIEVILKQYFDNIDIVAKDAADIEITDQEDGLNILSKKSNQSWQIKKPVLFISLINIIEKIQQHESENVIIIGSIEFYPDLRLCKYNQEEIHLTQKESEILLYLAKHPNEVDKYKLLEEVWGYSDDISTHTLETHIYKLRSKFADKYELIISKDSSYSLNLQQKD